METLISRVQLEPTTPPGALPVLPYRLVTIATADRQSLFGIPAGERILPTPLGDLVRITWLARPILHPELVLDMFVVMPDHFQALLRFGSTDLNSLLSRFKASVTLAAHRADLVVPAPLWQRGHHEWKVESAELLGRVRLLIASRVMRLVHVRR